MKRAFPALFALLIAALALGITALLWRHERRSEQDGLRTSFDFGVRQTASRIEQRMASYEQMLRGVQGYFMAADHVDSAGFGTYVDALLGGADFAGLQSITYGPLVRAEPGAKRPDAVPVTYVAPAGTVNMRVLGYDLFSDPMRRAALEQARDSGGTALTGRIRLVTETGEGPAYAFLMVLPLYAKGQPTDTVAARRAHIVGWVWAAFRAGDLMSSLYGEGTPGLELRVYDGVAVGHDTLIFGTRADAGTASKARFDAQEYIGLAGHTWTLKVTSLPAFEEQFSRDSSSVILMAGVALSALLGAIAYQLLTARARADGAARSMTRELRGSEERYRRIVETANEGIWTVAESGEITFANPKLLQMLGCTAADVQGRRLDEFVDEGDRSSPDVRLRRKDGSELWVSASTAPILDASGARAGMLGMVTDITERKQSDAKRELLETQLRESQKMEAIGTLAGGIAHDFNNILAAILGSVVLARRYLSAEHGAADGLDQIEQAGVRARSLVQKILAFSRLQPHALASQLFRPLVEDAIVLLRATLPSGVTLDVKLTDVPLHVRADATNIQQILMNLGTNAWHAMNNGTGRITVSLDRTEIDPATARLLGDIPAGAYAHLTVGDDGTGMSEATRARVFEPFFTTKRVGEGTGLGLSVVHGIVVAHHGAIAVESEPGQGSAFHLYFPVSPAPHVAVTPAEAEAQAAPRGHGEHIMYVDDDPAMLLTIEGLLQHAGYRVTIFDHPQDALGRVRMDPTTFDLIVTDFNMPDMNGVDLAQHLAQVAPGVPVVISSGYLSDDIRAAALRAGVQGLLQKEYSVERLAGLVHQVLAERAPRSAAPAGKSTRNPEAG